MNLLDFIGIDEVGRGCLAGPMIIAITSAKEAAYQDERIQILNDSKKLSEKKREQIASWLGACFDILLCEYSAQIIDSFGLSACYAHAQQKALELYPKSQIIIDGIVAKEGIKAVVSADALYPSVMAASIGAKVYRDNLMKAIKDEIYGFAKHKGYGTKAHIQAIKEFGLSNLHRRSFCSKIAPLTKLQKPTEASDGLWADDDCAQQASGEFMIDCAQQASGGAMSAAQNLKASDKRPCNQAIKFEPKLIYLS